MKTIADIAQEEGTSVRKILQREFKARGLFGYDGEDDSDFWSAIINGQEYNARFDMKKLSFYNNTRRNYFRLPHNCYGVELIDIVLSGKIEEVK